MAGQVITRDLGLELFRIDLATVVSNSIGETEKNLDRIFEAATGSNAILFDEADALFGKRSEVRDAHDRYANIEVAYLLQKMESYPGAVILATNFRQNMDDGFLRRLDFVIDFLFPEAEDRERIWRLLLPGGGADRSGRRRSFPGDPVQVRRRRDPKRLPRRGLPRGRGRRGSRWLTSSEAWRWNTGKFGRLTLESDFERFHELIRPRNGGQGRPGGSGASICREECARSRARSRRRQRPPGCRSSSRPPATAPSPA